MIRDRVLDYFFHSLDTNPPVWRLDLVYYDEHDTLYLNEIECVGAHYGGTPSGHDLNPQISERIIRHMIDVHRTRIK